MLNYEEREELRAANQIDWGKQADLATTIYSTSVNVAVEATKSTVKAGMLAKQATPLFSKLAKVLKTPVLKQTDMWLQPAQFIALDAMPDAPLGYLQLTLKKPDGSVLVLQNLEDGVRISPDRLAKATHFYLRHDVASAEFLAASDFSALNTAGFTGNNQTLKDGLTLQSAKNAYMKQHMTDEQGQLHTLSLIGVRLESGEVCSLYENGHSVLRGLKLLRNISYLATGVMLMLFFLVVPLILAGIIGFAGYTLNLLIKVGEEAVESSERFVRSNANPR
ncbi:hypothetical protein ABHF33_14015 [Chitinibacter sp. FCG-7]|uniref:Uncharacterized protein n=1 Tax=Chitinibacter mangrovi TaxID=3153927 RepID=A0AAU7F7M4_9NEIS